MNKPLIKSRPALLLALLLVGLPALAEPGAAQQRYQQDMSACKTASVPSQAACRRDAGAALAAASRGDLDDGPAAYERNAHQRCMALPAPERFECVARLRAPASGTVAGGGLLREAVTPESATGVPAK
jgi:hypothetical protein